MEKKKFPLVLVGGLFSSIQGGQTILQIDHTRGWGLGLFSSIQGGQIDMCLCLKGIRLPKTNYLQNGNLNKKTTHFKS